MNIREKVLRYDTTTTFADYVLDYPRERYYADGVDVAHDKEVNKIDIDNLIPYSKIFLKTDLIPSLVNIMKSIKVPFHIISGNSALSPRTSDMLSIASNRNMVSWSGANLPKIDNRFLQVPIGFPGLGKLRPNSYIDIPDIPKKGIQIIMTPLSKDTHASRKDLPINSNMLVLEEKLDYLSYLNFLGKSKYSICPRGYGVDTHRVYESIVMGSVPVVLSSILDEMYSNIGCKVLKSWNEIDTLIDNPSVDRQVVTVEYWKNKILNHQKICETNNDLK